MNVIPGHESTLSLMASRWHIRITLLYTDRDPVDIVVTVGAKRALSAHQRGVDFGRHTAKEGEQYAIMLESD